MRVWIVFQGDYDGTTVVELHQTLSGAQSLVDVLKAEQAQRKANYEFGAPLDFWQEEWIVQPCPSEHCA